MSENSSTNSKQLVLKAGIILGLFSLIGIGLVSLTHTMTYEKIAENQRNFILKNLAELVPETAHDNDLLEDTLEITDQKNFGSKQAIIIYRAYKAGKPVAVILTPTAPDGYNGSIRLLVAIKVNGELAGVRAVSHHETPGLGDAIDTNKNDWILGFEGLSLGNPDAKYWRVKRDGGTFDQFTGATITPRAVVKAVYKTLDYYQTHQQELFKRTPKTLASNK